MVDPTTDAASRIVPVSLSIPRPLRRSRGYTVDQLFWSVVDVRGYDECWPWQGGCNGQGYGTFYVKAGELGLDRDRQPGTHRVAFRLIHGRWPEPWVLHGCDNPPCCNALNPAHLHEGDGIQNSAEKFARGREGPSVQSGETHARAALTNQQVRNIRARYAAGNVYLSELAAEYGVSRTCISYIVKRKRYAEVI